MCFRTTLAMVLFHGVIAQAAIASPLNKGSDPLRPLVRVVSRDPGVVEVRLEVARVDREDVELRLGGSEGVRRTPFRADAAHPGWLAARIDTPGALRPGVTLRAEIWAHDGEEWALREPVMVAVGGASPEEAPDWAKGVVWYQVFPERFRNGNLANDPRGWDLTLLGWDEPFHAVSHEEIEMLWNRRVVDPRFYSSDPGRWSGGWGSVGQVIFQRRYGGDLQGVVDMLDHIAGLGATGLYLCPVFEARSLHKYEALDHRHVDPTLGHPGEPGPVDRSGEDPLDETTWGWEPADRYLIDVLIPEARKRGLRVILDGVWNHVGREHFAFRDVVEHGAASRYADWFKAEFDPEDGRLVRYEAWDRPNGALPEFRQTPEGDLAPGPKAHVYAVTRRWMAPDGDPGRGIDGWRLDVAPDIGRAFWRDWRALVRSINPEAVLVGEIWTDAALWFDGAAFDAQMNYPLAYPIADWLSIGRADTDAARFAERVNAVLHHHPRHTLAQMTLIASHDTERGASLMQNDFARGFDQQATPWTAGSRYDAGPVGAEAKRRLLTAYALLAVLPGSPMIYNGDEFALPGADDPDNRRPIPWPDLGEHPDGPDGAFLGDVAALLGWRGSPGVEGVLRFGAVEVVAGPGDGVVVRRWLGGRMVEAAIARTGEPTFRETPLGWAVEDLAGPEGGSEALEGVIRVRVLSYR
ncbi:MAG: hypothetical protein LAT64_08015 [Phycisphaerales bacterium]|nr:hypothetical protein [Planctomycetota bacterium]MCH8508700.1 hypothetical protein [Phycisphaerales bacterium]